MKFHKRYMALGAIACGLFSGIAAHADEFNLKTEIAFSAPVQIPGMVLAAGTYTFNLVDPDHDQSVVEISNASGTKVYAMLVTVPADRAVATNHTQVTLAETGAGNVPVLTQWFYPGQKSGFQFLYPTKVENQIKQANEQAIVAHPLTSAQLETGE